MLLGSISQERRKITWAKIKVTHLRGLWQERCRPVWAGFFGKSFKKLEVDKAIAKVSQPSAFSTFTKRAKYSKDKSDHRSVLSKDTPGSVSRMRRSS